MFPDNVRNGVLATLTRARDVGVALAARDDELAALQLTLQLVANAAQVSRARARARASLTNFNSSFVPSV